MHFLKKGIAMATLVVIISVMLILLSVITITGINISNTSRKIAFASELKMLQDSVDGYITKNLGEYPVSEFVTIDLSLASDDVKKQFEDNGEEILDSKVILNKIDYTKLDLTSLTRGTSDTNDDIYVVSTKTGKVYYAKGLKIGNNTYYTLTDELKNLVEYNSKSNEVLTNDAIIFETSTNEWTNSNIEVKVKVPRSYVDSTITINGNPVTGVSTIDTEAYITHSLTISNNCNLEVNYKDSNNLDRTSSFDITNIDKQKPEINITNIKQLDTNKKYLEIKGNDLESGIKIIKYDTDKITNDEIGRIYFNSNGIEVKNNIIEVEDNIPYITLYIEDNAGNYQIVTKEV